MEQRSETRVGRECRLADRLKNLDDTDEWREFSNSYWRSILCLAMRRGCNRPEAEDAAQETLASVARQIGKFRLDPAMGSFHAWVMRIASCRIADQFRARKKTLDTHWIVSNPNANVAETEPKHEEAAGGWEEHWNRETQLDLLNKAMLRVRTQVKPKPFEAYRLALCEELRVSEIAKRLDLKSAEVSLAKHRVGVLMRKEIRRIQRETDWQNETTPKGPKEMSAKQRHQTQRLESYNAKTNSKFQPMSTPVFVPCFA